MTSGGSGACRSRGRREAMPNPVRRVRPSAQFTRILAGLTSLWTRPRWCALPSAATMPMARRRKRPASIGAPMSRSSGSPPGSSSSSAVRPPSRASASGRAAHAASSSSLSSYSWARRSRLAGGGRSAAAAQPARSRGCRRCPRATPGRRRDPHPPTEPGGRLFPERRTETIAPIAMLRRPSRQFAVNPVGTNLCHDQFASHCGIGDAA